MLRIFLFGGEGSAVNGLSQGVTKTKVHYVKFCKKSYVGKFYGDICFWRYLLLAVNYLEYLSIAMLVVIISRISVFDQLLFFIRALNLQYFVSCKNFVRTIQN